MRPSQRVKPRLPQPACHRTRRESQSPGKSGFISSCEERQSHGPSAVATGYIYAYILWTEAHGKGGCDAYVSHADLRMWIRTGEVDIEILPQSTKVWHKMKISIRQSTEPCEVRVVVPDADLNQRPCAWDISLFPSRVSQLMLLWHMSLLYHISSCRLFTPIFNQCGNLTLKWLWDQYMRVRRGIQRRSPRQN